MYFSPSISLGTTKDKVLTSRSATLTHDLRLLSYFSSKYPVTAEPPSEVGGCHDNVTESAVMPWAVRGPVGLVGLSLTHRRKGKKRVNVLSLKSIFTTDSTHI